MNLILVAFGLVALLAGGDLLVRGAVGVARRFGVSPLVIGLTLVGFGTSAPELVTSLSAALAGAPAIALGNVVGSNIANILLILGVAALIRPVAAQMAGLLREASWVGGSALALAALAVSGQISTLSGACLIGFLGFYLWGAFRSSSVPSDDLSILTDPLPKAATLLVIGLALTIGGAIALVDGATGIARAYGVPEAVIGLTLVAVGTSLPELATTVMAARRGQSDVALGNILGSGIFNILGILGATALVVPLPVDASLLPDIGVMLASTALLIGLLFWKKCIGRKSGGMFLLLYAGYMAWLSQTF
ncbi:MULTISPECIES: calcium/sodium antiporter [Marivita]|uniref:Calcium/sodium antiporter n=1 Tax=Marivita cryptomonadis TaxID=505252 RepID=A0A9Q2RZ17_9RHOB|nr:MULTISPECIES: calcium/sodium antiporter [Marivita]MCR9169609.1 calcium/sodium antiporter [Paracoccaceae bacterium]MBM2320782.1 calcium/sodium antiporter [Marivita cryptomonadis]MBM2330362.1 calcium/sodium antiporter [Marivita cryptomonadis]MBM2339949.1 calcium/sodium antiporter [Marivita cryptomonadis]MBM2344609.1 calcium/sodium antiporter [Marivita cryptomonadis]